MMVVGDFLGRRAEGNGSRGTQTKSMLAADCGDDDVPLDLVFAVSPMRIGLRTPVGADLDPLRQDAMADQPVGNFAGDLGLRLTGFAVAAGRFHRVCEFRPQFAKPAAFDRREGNSQSRQFVRGLRRCR